MQKSELRTLIKERIKLFSESSDSVSMQAQQIFLRSTLYKNATQIFAYCSLKDEINTKQIILQATKDEKKIALPRIEQWSTKKNQMDFYFVNPNAFLKNESMFFLSNYFTKNDFGIFEPHPKLNEKVKIENDAIENTVFIVPGLAFSRQGIRLGRGMGFYDSYIENVRHTSVLKNSAFVGFCFSFQVLDFVPHEKHDQRMTHILTELGLSKI